jgi:2-phospho-L-lactate guanylyltransferase
MTKNETNFVIIPVKKTDRAKSRLSKYLPDEIRKQFCLAMFEDVIKTVKSTDRVQEVIVVSNDHFVPQLVEKFRAVLLLEKTHGLNGNISEAINLCVEMGATSTLVLPADIPLIAVEDLEEIYSLGERASMVVAASRDGRGTNALLLKPPKISPTFYGPFSFQKHIQEATKLGIKFLCYNSLRIALDIDTINDLEYFVSLKAKQTVAYNELEKAGLTNIFETSL